MLKSGQKIPLNIKVLDEKNKKISLDNLLGQPLVIYFYPKNFTQVCTKQAEQFRDSKYLFDKIDVDLIGITSDSPESNRRFKQELDLNFQLLSDPNHELQRAFGVWQERRLFNQTQMNTIRTTFAVDKKGEILKVWPRVNVEGHAQDILNFFRDRNDSK